MDICDCWSIFYSFILLLIEWEWVWFGFFYILFTYLIVHPHTKQNKTKQKNRNSTHVDWLVVGCWLLVFVSTKLLKLNWNKRKHKINYYLKKSHHKKHLKFNVCYSLFDSICILQWNLIFILLHFSIFFSYYYFVLLFYFFCPCFSVNLNFKWRVEKFQSYTKLTLIYIIFSLNCRTKYGNIIRFKMFFFEPNILVLFCFSLSFLLLSTVDTLE